MVAVKGYQLRRVRYGGKHHDFVKELEETEKYTAAELRELQNERLRMMISHCYRHVPFYAEWMRDHKLRPDDIACVEDLSKMPIVTKDMVKAAPERFRDQMTKRSRVFVDHTSGTTGSPIEVWVDLDALRYEYALQERSRSWAGIESGGKKATFSSRIIVPINQTRPPFWRWNPAARQMLFSVYHISWSTAAAYAAQLCDLAPNEIRGYPSAIYFLATLIRDLDLPHPTVEAVRTDSEKLFAYQRKTIEQVFNCKVYDWYGLVERVIFGAQCESMSYHLFDEIGYVEILPNDSAASGDNEGRLVCTSLLNYAMPLIRYEVGDLVVPAAGLCGCGRHHTRVAEITGRTDQVLTTPDGRQVGQAALSTALYTVPTVRECQIVQTSVSDITVIVVPSKSYSQPDEDELVRQLRARIGDDIVIHVQLAESIERGANAKYCLVRSEIDS